MLITLPACLAFGFCLGYIWGAWGSTRPAFWNKLFSDAPPPASAVLERDERGRWLPRRDRDATVAFDGWRIWVVCAFVTIAGFAVLASGWASSGHLLWLAGGIVGLLAGKWFQSPEGSRDKLVFLAGAAMFLFFGALEYDHKIFNNLSKIGGSEFSVEFAAPAHGAGDRPAALAPSQGYLSILFPGASALDFSFSNLKRLPIDIMNDNKYSIIFSQQELKDIGIDQMPALAQLYLNYVCRRIRPFAANLMSVQSEYRSEMSDLSAYPLFVRELRKNYIETALNLQDSSSSNVTKSDNASSDSAALNSAGLGKIPADLVKILLPQIFKPNLGQMFSYDKQLIDEDYSEIEQVHKPVSAAEKGNDKDVMQDNDETLLYGPNGICGVVGKLLSQLSSTNIVDKPPGAAWWEAVKDRDNNKFNLLTYFALTVANTEFALSAHETAIQFLENEIEKLRANLAETPFGADVSQGGQKCASDQIRCQETIMKRAEFIRNTILLLRLEFTRNSMMAFSTTSATDLVRIRRWIKQSKDYDRALTFFDPEGSHRRSLLREGPTDARPAQCAPQIRAKGTETTRLFGKFTLAEFSAKNNAVNIAASDPAVLDRQPLVVQDLDDFSSQIASVDVDCLSLLIGQEFGESDVLTTKARFLDSAAGYLLAKGQNFGASDEDAQDPSSYNVSQIERTKALCRAKSAYLKAADFAKSAVELNSRRAITSLDEEIQHDNEAEFPYGIMNGLHRTNLALADLPAADIASLCSKP